MKCYLLTGTTGRYDDHVEWTVVVYKNKETAETHKKLLESWITSHEIELNGNYDIVCPYDEKLQYDGEVCYYISEIEVLDISPDKLREHLFIENI